MAFKLCKICNTLRDVTAFFGHTQEAPAGQPDPHLGFRSSNMYVIAALWACVGCFADKLILCASAMLGPSAARSLNRGLCRVASGTRLVLKDNELPELKLVRGPFIYEL